MKNIVLVFFLFGFVTIGFAQIRKPILKNKDLSTIKNRPVNDSLRKGSSRSTSNKDIKNKDAKIEDYLIISHVRDTTYVDTTLTIQKEYKFNYLRRDNFELLPFSNVGQTYNSLSYNYKNNALMPNFGASARHFNYMEIEDINYYHVPTPLTELYYKTAFEQGQQLDAFFTVNTSKQLNFSIAYKGLRSLGKYQHILTSTGNFRFTTSYKTKNKRYVANAHMVSQDLLNQENGGLKDSNIEFFESGSPEFNDRGVLEVNFEDAESILKGKRFHLDHQYYITKPNDSLAKNTLSVGHIISFEDKYFEFNQTRANAYFGDAFQTNDLRDRATLENFYNQLHLNYNNVLFGDFQFNVSHNNYNYGYDQVVILTNQNITNRLKGDVVSVGGKYHKVFNKFYLQGDVGVNVSGDFDANYIIGSVNYNLNDDAKVKVEFSHSSQTPEYNFMLYQSDYINYNWQNNFNNIETQQLSFELKSKKWFDAYVGFTTINDYTYFKKDDNLGFVKPFQSDKSITYLKVKLEKGISFKSFTLYNTIMYQNVKDDNSVFNLPEFVTRNSLYYSNHFFKKALYLQTGITFRYFTSYYMNNYDPLLAEFYVQNNKEIGSFPRLDFFINAKISQTRIYLKAEHFNSAWTGYDFYSAQNYPYRDFTVRFGLVWNFFL